MKPVELAATDCAARGATCVLATLLGFRPTPTRHMIAPPGWATSVLEADPDLELPFRVDLADPLPIVRDRTGELLLDESDPESCFVRWTPETATRVSRAASFLLRQVGKGQASRYAVVVPDELSHESAHAFLDALRSADRLSRSRLALVPWPVAAAWAWIAKYAHTLAIKDLQRLEEAGSVLCVQHCGTHFASVVVRIVECCENPHWGLVPARNRDRDSVAWEKGSYADLAKALPELVRSSSNCIGIVVCGRGGLTSSDGLSRALAELGESQSVTSASEKDFDSGLLTNGALLASSMVASGGIPYFETVPKIEILVTKQILEDRPKPSVAIKQWAWLDCLDGVSGSISIGGGIMIPANRSLVHRPSVPGLLLKPGETSIKVAFDERDVRQIEAIIDEKVGREKNVALQVHYQLGSGRPRVTIERPRYPDSPIDFQWDTANVSLKSRDEISPYSIAEVDQLNEMRQQRRIKAGMSPLEISDFRSH